jgi:uncharacterized membrane protein (DUF485 family)
MTDPSPPDHGDDHPQTITRNARNGLILFAVYVILYLGFMLLSAFAPQRMQQPVLAGVNLAIIYGMGLILAALALALIYMFLCR